jgi:hypothetical protein
MIPFEIDQYAFETLQRLALDANPLTKFEERPRLGVKSGGYNRLNTRNLVVFDGHRNLAAANNGNHPRGNENW